MNAREEVNTPGELQLRVEELTHAVTEVIEACIPKVAPMPHQKHWWSPLLTAKQAELCRLTRRVYSRKREQDDPVHLEHKEVRRAYGMLVDKAKREHWDGFLASLDKRTIWTAHQYTSGDPKDGGWARIPPLRGSQTSVGADEERLVESNEDKSRVLCATFFPELERDDTSHADIIYLAPKFKFSLITDEQIHRAIAKLGLFKVPGPDGIPNIMLIKCADLLIPHLGPLYWTTFKLGVYPAGWRDSVTVVLRKPGKADYTALNAHWLVALLNTIVKVMSACMAEDLIHAAETHGLLPNNHFRSHPRCTTTDSLHYVTKFVKDAWRKQEVVSALFLDIMSAFPSIMLEQLVHDMRIRGVPSQYTNWISCKVNGH